MENCLKNSMLQRTPSQNDILQKWYPSFPFGLQVAGTLQILRIKFNDKCNVIGLITEKSTFLLFFRITVLISFNQDRSLSFQEDSTKIRHKSWAK